ncbi:hypothetical protein IQ273_12985 [Nodosilinea sp. LEGE 07298]|uniref:TrbI/VirB10 family protein n=1 Tax=Nodosilinea sp. LEGE 07298 TaxID=2777970 RepID=UPI00187E3FC5|nr:TrbI/VirB10 family protein [Nodosilinea sp. LEGE 07298]MBE9110328.1 hypothetical protein [Nodosilinea sp. LEGE 07298]
MSSLPEPNLDTLREMMGAPDLAEPLVAEEAFTEPVQSERPFWKLPVPKLVLIGSALVPVFALAGVFIAGSRQGDAPDTAATTPEANQTEAQPQTVEAELEQARAEIAALKAQMALEDQGVVQTTTSGAPPRPTTTPTPSPPASVAAPSRPTSQPVASTPPPTISARPASPAVSYPAPTPRLQPAATTTPVVSRPSAVPAAPTPAAAPAVNPVERWQQLAQVGSYGSLPLPEEEGTTEPGSVPETVAQAQFAYATTLPPAPAPVSPPESTAVEEMPEFSTAEPSEIQGTDGLDEFPITASEAVEVSYPDILTADEARILQPSAVPASLVAGTQSRGSLTTPVILDSTAEGNNLLVVLSEPLVDSQGQVAIPAGGELVVQVDTVSDNGLVQLSATQAIWNDQGQARELMLPQGVIQIRGQGGMPLQAEAHDDIGPGIAAMDAGQFALGSIRRASELYTQPNTRVETGSGSTVVTTENPAPNVLAGVLEGGTDAILDTITERNQRAIEELEQRPRIAYIEAGRPVQVFVNQSMQMPI